MSNDEHFLTGTGVRAKGDDAGGPNETASRYFIEIFHDDAFDDIEKQKFQHSNKIKKSALNVTAVII